MHEGCTIRPIATWLAYVSPRFTHVASFWPGWSNARQRQKAASSGLVGVPMAKGYLLANLPRSVLANRASRPLVAISRAMAAYNVAEGVLPLGEDQ